MELLANGIRKVWWNPHKQKWNTLALRFYLLNPKAPGEASNRLTLKEEKKLPKILVKRFCSTCPLKFETLFL